MTLNTSAPLFAPKLTSTLCHYLTTLIFMGVCGLHSHLSYPNLVCGGPDAVLRLVIFRPGPASGSKMGLRSILYLPRPANATPGKLTITALSIVDTKQPAGVRHDQKQEQHAR